MVLSYSGDSLGQARPTTCRCSHPNFHHHGKYWRVLSAVWVCRFKCSNCCLTVSMLPSRCVPYKHYPSSIVSRNMAAVLLKKRSVRATARKFNDVHRTTIGRWLNQFASHCPQLVLTGFPRLGLKAVSSSAQQLYQALHDACNGEFFSDVQPALCRQYPPLGIFRFFTVSRCFAVTFSPG